MSKGMDRFKNRYVLGEGYPYVDADGRMGCQMFKYKGKGSADKNNLSKDINKFALDDDCPMYRLVLEKVKAKRGKK